MGKLKVNPDINNKKCRTCLNNTKGLVLLKKIINEDGTTTVGYKTYGDLLEEVTQINTLSDVDNKSIPQRICSICRRKLLSAYDFIKQAKEVNTQLWNSFNIFDTCLEEHKIEYPLEIDLNLTQIKTETSVELPESEDDMVLCKVQLKMEQDEEHSKYPGNQLSQNQTQCDDWAKNDFVDSFEKIIIENKELPESEDDILLCKVELKMEQDEEHSKNSGNQLSKIQTQRDDWAENDCEENFKCMSAGDKENEKQNQKTTNFEKRNTKSRKKQTNTEDESNFSASCDICNKKFHDLKKLTVHRRKIHKISNCPLCDHTFERPGNIYRHMRESHGEEYVRSCLPPVRDQSQKMHKCDKCDKTFHRRLRLKNHIERKHNNPKKKEPRIPLCHICGSSFSRNADLIIHIKRHTGEKPFRCELCDKAFHRPNELRAHQRVHTDEKPFICKECGKSFRFQYTLKAHLRSHTDDRPYQCTDCEKAFKFPKHLNVHKRTHTGERPYSCDICGDTFTQVGPLKAHRTKCILVNGNT